MVRNRLLESKIRRIARQMLNEELKSLPANSIKQYYYTIGDNIGMLEDEAKALKDKKFTLLVDTLRKSHSAIYKYLDSTYNNWD